MAYTNDTERNRNQALGHLIHLSTPQHHPQLKECLRNLEIDTVAITNMVEWCTKNQVNSTEDLVHHMRNELRTPHSAMQQDTETGRNSPGGKPT